MSWNSNKISRLHNSSWPSTSSFPLVSPFLSPGSYWSAPVDGEGEAGPPAGVCLVSDPAPPVVTLLLPLHLEPRALDNTVRVVFKSPLNYFAIGKLVKILNHLVNLQRENNNI